ncbi:MAG: hypothetical protein RL033_7047 [Pseudomonadota bacterium]
MRQAWMAMNRRMAQLRCACAAVRYAALGAAALGGPAIGCSDAPRVADADRVSAEVSIIDDMEDGTQYILSDDGRVGLWYTYNDMSPGGTQEPSVGFPMYQARLPNGGQASPEVPLRDCGGGVDAPFFANEESCDFVARTAGTGQRGWGAGIGVDLNGEGGVKNPFDASEFGGIGFFVQGNVRGGRVRVNVQDVRTTPESAAAADRRNIGRCTDELTSRCNDHYGFVVTGVRADAWRWVSIPFSCMAAGAWGYPSYPGSAPAEENRLRRDAVVGVQFQIEGADPTDTGMAGMVQPFDFAIDNLAFLRNVNDNSACPAPVTN